VAEELVAAHPQCCEFSDALRMARWGPPDVAWSRLLERLPTWRPVEHAQVAPVELLTHRPVRGWMTRARCEQLLATPRASWWWEPRAPRA
jgi:hypothetical protein